MRKSLCIFLAAMFALDFWYSRDAPNSGRGISGGRFLRCGRSNGRGRVKRDIWVRMGKLFNVFRKKPYVDGEKCVKCGVCVESCPVDGKALTFKNGKKEPPVYNYKKCIRCFCCQEMCPHKAIRVR